MYFSSIPVFSRRLIVLIFVLINISFHLSCLLYFRIFSFHCSSGFLKFLRYIVAIYVLVSRALPDGGRALNPLHSISSVFFGFPFFEDHKALVGWLARWKVHSISSVFFGLRFSVL